MTQKSLILYAFPAALGTFNFSPFCSKADILLRMAGLQFSVEIPEDHKALPKGKLPVLKDGDTLIPDSEFIRLHIEQKYGHSFDAGLTAAQKATGHAVCRMLEERTMLAVLWSRWADEAGWQKTRPIFFAGVPDAVAEEVRQPVLNRLTQNGYGLHSQSERDTLINADLATVAALIGEQDYFFGSEPSYVDACIFPMIANLYGSAIQTPTTALVAAYPTLVGYYKRGMQRWFPGAE